MTGSDAGPRQQLHRLDAELHDAVAALESVLADPSSEGLARLGNDGDLIVSPRPAEQVPTGAEAIAEATSALLPRVQLPALLIEVDQMTGFSEEFTHAGGAQSRNPKLRRNLYAALITYACNLGYAGMADASGISEDQLAWTSQWYLRQDTLRAANTRWVNAYHAHPLAALRGGGTLSSSEGQRFPQRGRSLTVRALSRYFLDEGTTTYTHVSDQHSTYGTKVIPTTWRDAVAVLDEIFGNPTDLPLGEHTVDTAGQNLATFAIFNLAGLQFSPRIRDIGRLKLAIAVSACRAAARPADPDAADRRALERPTSVGRVDEVRAHHRQPAHRQAAHQQPTEQPRQSAPRIPPAHAHHLRLPLRRRQRTAPASASPAQ